VPQEKVFKDDELISMMSTNQEKLLLDAYAAEPDPLYPDAFRWLPVTPLKRARIATNLAPRAKRYLSKNSNFYVVGYDCPNLTQSSYTKWEEFLVYSCRQGCSFSYYLGKTNPLAIERFREIAKASGARAGQIQVYTRDHKGSVFAESYANQWRTFHFAVFENPRQLWIETLHPEGKTEAYNCYYLPPSKAKNEGLLDTCKLRFEMVTRECATRTFVS
jgi:hypothetical protein